MKESGDKSYYEILKVPIYASDQQIKESYRKLAAKYHPDKLPEDKKDNGEKLLKELNEAYATIGNPEKRRKYDLSEMKKKDINLQTDSDSSDEYGMYTSEKHKQMDNIIRKELQERTPPVFINEEMTLEEIYTGKEVKREIYRFNLCQECRMTGYKHKAKPKCKTCDGKGKVIVQNKKGTRPAKQVAKCPACDGITSEAFNLVTCDKCLGKKLVMGSHSISYNIPPGAHDKDTMIIQNQGHATVFDDQTLYSKDPENAYRGIIKIKVKEKPHKIFNRDLVINKTVNHANVCMNVEITLLESLCGFKKAIKHLDGRLLVIEEREPIRHDDMRFIENEGFPYKGNRAKKGTLFVKYKVTYPRAFSDAQKKLITEALSVTEYGLKIKPTNEEIPKESVVIKTIEVERYRPDYQHSSFRSTYESSDEDDKQKNGCTTQ